MVSIHRNQSTPIRSLSTLTIIVLPEIDKRPIKPNLQPIILVHVLPDRPARNAALPWHGLSWLGVELIGLNCLESSVLAETGHAGDKLVGTDTRV
jgi:hypothetical protein